MSNGSFSALRADVADSPAVAPEAAADANSDAYGSLSGLGGPRKFKKKPVLVLDPEELERAHLLFQEASAEALGEEFQRPERPAAVPLGLAPMDDEDTAPEDMGEDEEGAEDDDNSGFVKVDAVLGLDKVRRGLPDEDDGLAMQDMEPGPDCKERIFPNLPLQQDVAEDFDYAEAARLPEEPPVEEVTALPEAEDLQDTEPASEDIAVPAATEATAEPPRPALESLRELAAERMQASLEPRDEVAPVRTVEETASEPAEQRAPRIEDVPEEQPPHRYVAPFDPPASTSSTEAPPIESGESELPEWAEAADFGFDMAPSYTAPETPQSEVQVEVYGENAEFADEVPSDDDSPVAEMQSSPSTTYFEGGDEAPVDGRAFMYADSPRGRTIHALAEGTSNSLRARLIRERQQESTEADPTQHEEGVLLWRCWHWLRGLFSRGGPR